MTRIPSMLATAPILQAARRLVRSGGRDEAGYSGVGSGWFCRGFDCSSCGRECFSGCKRLFFYEVSAWPLRKGGREALQGGFRPK